MTNLCLVVIAAQFQKTKNREEEILKQSSPKHRQISRTVSISTSEEGCYTQILKYIEDSCRRLTGHLRSWIKMEKSTISERCRGKSCIEFRKRKANVKSIHHHHHHYHYYCHCDNTRSYKPSTSEIPDSPHTPSGSPIFEMFSISPSPDHDPATMQDTLDPRNAKEDKRTLMVPQMHILTESATTVYHDSDANSSGEMVSMATANINVQGHETSASVVIVR